MFILQKNMQPQLIHKDRKKVIIWLSTCLFLVSLMVLLGGYTRLSGSGLSITSWKPIHGIIPPIDDAEWMEEFSAYKATPQYNLVNKGMELADFKVIFWPEFWHRVLGRTVGFVFFLPLLIFATRGSFSRQFFLRLTGIFALGGLQGAIGWIMVKSGLADLPYVSPIKLALHLSTAFAIFTLILWAILDVVNGGWWSVAGEKEIKKPSTIHHSPFTTYYFFLTLLAVQIIFGALVAGSHAGLLYNTWPSMNGGFLPDGIFAQPLMQNLGLIQFIHRNLAILVAIGFPLWWLANRTFIKQNRLNRICIVVFSLIFAQFALGVATLILQVPLPIALAHQMNALLLWAAAVWLWYKIKALLTR